MCVCLEHVLQFLQQSEGHKDMAKQAQALQNIKMIDFVLLTWLC